MFFRKKKSKKVTITESGLTLSSDSSNFVDSNPLFMNSISQPPQEITQAKSTKMKADTIALGPLVRVSLMKPIGLVLEENDIINIIGGVHVFDINPTGNAAQTGLIKEGMILTEINGENCQLLDFDVIVEMMRSSPDDEPLHIALAMPEGTIKDIIAKEAEIQIALAAEALQLENSLTITRVDSTKSAGSVTFGTGTTSQGSMCDSPTSACSGFTHDDQTTEESCSRSSSGKSIGREMVKKVVSRRLLSVYDDEGSD